MPLQQTSGAASYDAFGGGAPVAAKYIEDFFQTWLRTGTGSSTTVTTGLNASINKSLVWTKSRSAATNHKLTDTARGVTKALSSNTTGAEVTDSQGLTAFSSTGYTIGTNTDYNNSGATYVDWQWVATPKFFDVVTYTGNGTAGRTVSHNLGSTPGCIIIKRTDSSGFDWAVYHRNLSASGLPARFCSIFLNQTSAAGQYSTFWNETDPTSTDFTVGASSSVNTNGATYVAYLFAHNAGGFGLTGTDNVISCGSFVGTGAEQEINLGYEPQFVIRKAASTTSGWAMFDNMRGFSQTNTAYLNANLSNAESNYTGSDNDKPTATGFRTTVGSGQTWIYIAIRRGPMKTPTSGTSVYNGIASSGANGTVLSVGFPADADLWVSRGTAEKGFTDRLRGFPVTNAGTMPWLVTQSTAAEAAYSASTSVFNVDNTSATIGSYVGGLSGVHYFLRRAPGFMDVCCYTGTGANADISHNLGVVPELMIVKRRDTAGAWNVYSAGTGNAQYLILNSTAVSQAGALWRSTTPTASVFYLNDTAAINGPGGTFVAYLFASCPGVSKVGSYTGNGSSQTIDCGFAAGSRFVLIKRTNASGAWYVWDTARGIVSGNDPYLLLNSTDAEVTTNDSVDPVASGFAVNQVAATNINVSGASYIYLAIA